jgi:DNA helicase-2/ATP-dependent DNA helicase PcrA
MTESRYSSGMQESEILKDLNKSQQEAVTATEGPVLVVAGPGTGKTLTMVRRIAFLIASGTPAEHILALTFTNRAAREMQERVTALLGTGCTSFIGTFHALGLKMIKDNLDEDFTLYDRNAQSELLKKMVKEARGAGQSPSFRSYAGLAEMISRIKNGMEEINDDIRDIYNRYLAEMKMHSACDYDDLILLPVDLLRDESISERYRLRYKYIIVDEYQDINRPQYTLLKSLTGGDGNICAVGDPDQAIYAFRGADVGNFLDFERDFGHHRQIILTDNYRSTETIISSSSHMIKNNLKRIDREVTASGGKGRPISAFSVPDERAEADAVISEIECRMGGTSHYAMHSLSERDPAGRYCFSDFAVLYRTNAQACALEEAFSASSIPYQRIGGKNTLRSSSLEETMTFMRSLISEEEEQYSGGPAADETALLSPADYYDPSAEAVTLMTMHMAKGLEFRVVFIAGVEDGLMPCTVIDSDIDMEEERRLFYVSMTRAKEELFLLSARKRFLYGERLFSPPSPFIKEIPDKFIKATHVPDRVKKQKEDHQMGLF